MTPTDPQTLDRALTTPAALVEPAVHDAAIDTSAQRAPDPPVFVTPGGNSRRLVRMLGGACTAVTGLWLAAVVLGALGFGRLPALDLPLLHPPVAPTQPLPAQPTQHRAQRGAHASRPHAHAATGNAAPAASAARRRAVATTAARAHAAPHVRRHAAHRSRAHRTHRAVLHHHVAPAPARSHGQRRGSPPALTSVRAHHDTAHRVVRIRRR